MKYAPLAVNPRAPGELPDADELRAAAKTFILDRWQSGDIDEIECERLLAELGLRNA